MQKHNVKIKVKIKNDRYSCHPRAGGGLVVQQDSRFRGNDRQVLNLTFAF